jgi:hypothetical protein
MGRSSSASYQTKEVGRTQVANGTMRQVQADKFLQQAHVAAWKECVMARDAKLHPGAASNTMVPTGVVETGHQIMERRARTVKDFDDMSDIQEDGEDGLELAEELPSVIAEGFLWHVFLQLVDALIVLHQGNGLKADGKKWKEIVHRDIHSMYVFVKPGEGGEGTEDHDDDEVRAFDKKEGFKATLQVASDANCYSGPQYSSQTLTAPSSISKMRRTTMSTILITT